MNNQPNRTAAPGMTVTPEFFSSDAWDCLYSGAWGSLCAYLIEKPEIRESFRKETGKDLNSIVGRSPIEAMVDQATGYNAEIMAAWCDWVTVNFWGVETDSIPINAIQNHSVDASSKQPLKTRETVKKH